MRLFKFMRLILRLIIATLVATILALSMGGIIGSLNLPIILHIALCLLSGAVLTYVIDRLL